jgi:hypothetical protein
MTDTRSTAGPLLRPLRAPGSRMSIAREFAIPTTIDGIPVPLTFLRIQSDPRLIKLSSRVQAEVRMQFSPTGPNKTVETEDDATYRTKLEGWADALEIMLEEVLNELDRIKPARIPKTQEMV